MASLTASHNKNMTGVVVRIHLNRFGASSKWFSASLTSPPLLGQPGFRSRLELGASTLYDDLTTMMVAWPRRDMLDPIHHTATYERVVEQIRRVIYLGRYLPGDKLPPERELAQQLGVSRTTVREAIRMLEGENLIRVKRGATGGIIVAAQGAASGADRVKLTAEQE